LDLVANLLGQLVVERSISRLGLRLFSAGGGVFGCRLGTGGS